MTRESEPVGGARAAASGLGRPVAARRPRASSTGALAPAPAPAESPTAGEPLPGEPAADAPEPDRGWWWLVRPAVACSAAVRVGQLVEALVAAHDHHLPVNRLITAWDGRFYTSIAAHGYPARVDPHVHSVIAFFPLYPLLGRALHLLTGVRVGWLMLAVSWVAGVAMLAPAAMLARDRWGAAPARRAAVLLAVFPGAAVLGMTYADGLAAAFACTCLLLLERRRWLAAGLAGAAAGATLSLLTLPLLAAVAVFVAARRQPKALVTAAVLPAGAAAYLAYLWDRTGSPWTWSRVEHDAWGVHLSLPVGGTNFARYAFSHPQVAVVTALTIAIGVAGVAALLVRRAPAHWIAYVLVILAAAAFDGGSHPTPRYLFDAFPAVLALGAAIPRRLLPAVAAVSAAALAVLFLGYSLQNPLLLAP